MKPAGFRELEHTADWELQVWAPDLAGLFEQAALGMNSLAGTEISDEPRVRHSIAERADDPESLLVVYLQELLFWGEQDGIGFDEFDLQVTPQSLDGTLIGAPIVRREKEIKAVTFHNLRVERISGGLTVNIVFDV